ncbi:MAG TPA: hypothetical protein HA304_01580 [Methanosarcinales archaeon]|nr:hypothetical protein [Methanosarcinales archaeon]
MLSISRKSELPLDLKRIRRRCVRALPINCLPCIISLEKELEFMRESGEHMEFGIFDFYKVFSKAFGGEDGAGRLECKRGDVIKLPTEDMWCISCLRLLKLH